MTVVEFFNACSGFDWFYEMSDDHRVWSAGHARRQILLAESKTDPVKEAMWEAWAKHKYSGEPWGTEQLPPPQRSEFGLEEE